MPITHRLVATPSTTNPCISTTSSLKSGWVFPPRWSFLRCSIGFNPCVGLPDTVPQPLLDAREVASHCPTSRARHGQTGVNHGRGLMVLNPRRCRLRLRSHLHRLNGLVVGAHRSSSQWRVGLPNAHIGTAKLAPSSKACRRVGLPLARTRLDSKYATRLSFRIRFTLTKPHSFSMHSGGLGYEPTRDVDRLSPQRAGR